MPMKWVYVMGTADPFSALAKRRARVVGLTLARSRYGLVTGNSAGVDKAVATSYCAELKRQNLDQRDFFRQITLPKLSRGDLWPIPRYPSPPVCCISAKGAEEATLAAISKCHAAILIGGRWRSSNVARRFMDSGRPVFPLPFSGGRSDEIFQDIMQGWADSPIPGLTRSQALKLALPWASGNHPLKALLDGALCDQADIFISYRRTDSGSAVGRIHASLSDHFGAKRVFMDSKQIEPAAVWREKIKSALASCRIGLIIIGKRWLDKRLNDEGDMVRFKVAQLLSGQPYSSRYALRDRQAHTCDAGSRDFAQAGLPSTDGCTRSHRAIDLRS